MRIFKNILLIINLQTFIVSFLAVSSTAICIHYKYEADFPLTIITMSIVFPIVFSIGGAYKRREAALKEYAAIKGYLRALYFVPKDWLKNLNDSNSEKISPIFHQKKWKFTKNTD